MKKKNKLTRLAPLLVMMIVGAALGYFGGKYGLKNMVEIPKPVFLIVIIAMVPLFFLVIGFHEAGHALAGVKVGFDFRMYVIGPFLWEKSTDGWVLKWNRNINTAGGLVLCIPRGMENISNRFVVYAAGGPVASLLLAVGSWGVYKFMGNSDFLGSMALQGLAYSILVMAFLSFLIFIVTAIPFHTGGFSSDGARVFRLLKGGDASVLEVLFLKLVTESFSGVRPSALNKADLQEALRLSLQLNSPFLVYVYSYLFQAAFDNNETAAAGDYLQQYIAESDSIPDGLRSVVWLDAAFFEAYAHKDLDAALDCFKQFQPSAMIPESMILATEAAILLLQNKHAEVLNKTALAIKKLPDMMDKGGSLSLREKLQAMTAAAAAV